MSKKIKKTRKMKPKPSSPQQYQYLVYQLDTTKGFDDIATELNILGTQGWQLVTVNWVANVTTVMIILIRET